MKGFIGIVFIYAAIGVFGTTQAQTMSGAGNAAPEVGVTRATGSGQATASTTLSASDQKFFKEAAMGGMAEVADGEAADQQGSDPKVKQFGQQMATDHGKANDELKALAKKKDVTLPDAPSAKQQKGLSELKVKQGAAFDKAYAKMEVKDHMTTIALFETAAKSKDSDVSMFAQKTLPTLQHHLEMAKAL